MLQILGKSTSINVRKVLSLCQELFMALVRRSAAQTDPDAIAAGVSQRPAFLAQGRNGVP